MITISLDSPHIVTIFLFLFFKFVNDIIAIFLSPERKKIKILFVCFGLNIRNNNKSHSRLSLPRCNYYPEFVVYPFCLYLYAFIT